MRSKLKTLNKQTISFILRESFDMSDQLINEIVECVWNSDDHLETIQKANKPLQPMQTTARLS